MSLAHATTALKVLVTGGAGFIGSRLVQGLLAQGHEVVVIDDESSDGHAAFTWHAQASNHMLDINAAQADSLYAGVHVCFHLAARPSVQASMHDPLPTLQTQVMGTAAVLESCRRHGVSCVVLASTSACYGAAPLPHVESRREAPSSPYGVAKLAAEGLLRTYCSNFGMRGVSFRFTNVYGRGAREEGAYAPVVSAFLRARREGRDRKSVV